MVVWVPIEVVFLSSCLFGGEASNTESVSWFNTVSHLRVYGLV